MELSKEHQRNLRRAERRGSWKVKAAGLAVIACFGLPVYKEYSENHRQKEMAHGYLSTYRIHITPGFTFETEAKKMVRENSYLENNNVNFKYVVDVLRELNPDLNERNLRLEQPVIAPIYSNRK